MSIRSAGGNRATVKEGSSCGDYTALFQTRRSIRKPTCLIDGRPLPRAPRLVICYAPSLSGLSSNSTIHSSARVSVGRTHVMTVAGRHLSSMLLI